jgi:hypothetical protein
VSGPAAKSDAMINVAPGKKANGEASIRPYRIGTSSAIRHSVWDCSNVTGSGRWPVSRSSPSADLGSTERRERPHSPRWSTDKPPATHLFASGNGGPELVDTALPWQNWPADTLRTDESTDGSESGREQQRSAR